MTFKLPILKQELISGSVVTEESCIDVLIDTSVYSEERWEQHFPELAKREGLFQYIERISSNAASDRVKVACMLKAIYCFIESDHIGSYKQFAQMFCLNNTEYVDRLITSLKQAFNLVLSGSATKN